MNKKNLIYIYIYWIYDTHGGMESNRMYFLQKSIASVVWQLTIHLCGDKVIIILIFDNDLKH